MMLVRSIFLLFLISGSTVAQHMNHSIMASREDASRFPGLYKAGTDTINVLGVMVQFQLDNTPLTSGDGRFDLTTGSTPIIDAPPHNKQYFLDHATFVANYFRRSSKGKVVIRTTILDSIISLPGTMQSYSPPRTGSTVAVGNLARDTWQKVDSAGVVPDFSQYHCFIVFHAGIGRDIDLVNLLGYDPTPYDIPSLYIGLNAFRQYYGSGYQGIPVNAGTFHITNSIVLPESENRTVPTVTGTALLELGINGLFCASLGNFLGLPDLFDTNTGRSAIGRFGLMDGQSIFSFKGVFPPEPSAWEKYWLGWIDPIVLQAGEQTVRMPAVGIGTASGNFSIQDTVYRVPISAQEYYLLENRNRDAGRNGQRVTSTFQGASRVQTFPRDTTGFNTFDLDSLAGVITDVEDLDWSMPGGVSSDGTFFDGGILIWHIDEAVIAQGLQANGVNGNPLRRGVDLEEADGSQDIGQLYEFLSPGSGSEEGTALDFWYLGNGSPVNRNQFSSTTHPATRSNSGANSHITISEFTTRGPHMTAKVKVGDDVVKLLPGFPKNLGEKLLWESMTIADVNGDGAPDILVTSSGWPTDLHNVPPQIPGAKVYAWQTDGTATRAALHSNGLIARSNQIGLIGSFQKASVKVFNGQPEIIVPVSAAQGFGHLLAYQLQDIDGDSLADIFFLKNLPSGAVTPAVVGDSVIAVGGTRGYLYLYDQLRDSLYILRPIADTTAATIAVSLWDKNGAFIASGNDGTLAIARFGSPILDQARIGATGLFRAVTGILSRGGGIRTLISSNSGTHIFDRSLNLLTTLPPLRDGGSPALADLDVDGSRDIIGSVSAYNHTGALLDHFPIQLPVSTLTGTVWTASTPIVADVDGDGLPEVISATYDGLVVAYNKNGQMAPGFPLQAGTGMQTVAVFDIPNGSLSTVDIGLGVASSESGSVIAWRTGTTRFPYDAPKVRPWPQFQKDAQHSGLAIDSLGGSPLSSDFFPKTRAYNWPNPVYNGKTFIRYFVKDNATVNIKVFDLAGDLVTTIPNPPGVGGVDNEVEWNVAEVQSGIYFAQIEANGAGGSGVAIVKIAVVK